MITLEGVADILTLELQDRVDRMREILTSKNAVATDNLRSGIEFEANIYSDRVVGIISLPKDENGVDYSGFVDQGVDGTRSGFGSPFKFKNEGVSAKFERAIATWMKAKYGVGKGFDSKRGEFYGLGVKIKRDGIRPTRFFSDVINDTTTREIQDAIFKKFTLSKK